MENKEKCKCCGCLTVESICSICPVCFWQKDASQESNILDDGGPNLISLREAKQNYIKYGAIELNSINYVRLPNNDET